MGIVYTLPLFPLGAVKGWFRGVQVSDAAGKLFFYFGVLLL